MISAAVTNVTVIPRGTTTLLYKHFVPQQSLQIHVLPTGAHHILAGQIDNIYLLVSQVDNRDTCWSD